MRGSSGKSQKEGQEEGRVKELRALYGSFLFVSRLVRALEGPLRAL